MAEYIDTGVPANSVKVWPDPMRRVRIFVDDTMTHDFIPCQDSAGRRAYFDKVTGEIIREKIPVPEGTDIPDCRSCCSPSCEGCNIHTLITMLHKGKFDCLMDEHHCINPETEFAPVVHWRWIKTEG